LSFQTPQATDEKPSHLWWLDGFQIPGFVKT
jgi:hypothetical protein